MGIRAAAFVFVCGAVAAMSSPHSRTPTSRPRAVHFAVPETMSTCRSIQPSGRSRRIARPVEFGSKEENSAAINAILQVATAGALTPHALQGTLLRRQKVISRQGEHTSTAC
eukprot:NODE_2713_length_552_cov_71.500994_g2331_i0.p2 GENE.NODE_2713_length_552_cov_71.500994_g2331_i0~~NODE_2713_length_552_cov_71.500994_g2331_i0.p2  ORF type:complete len:122 (-),score=27.32 NODE_2713_length_552_cov_71.500994_g2331_i0:185-520(-)